MSNTHQLTAKIHELIAEFNQKTGKGISIMSDYLMNNVGTQLITKYTRAAFRQTSEAKYRR